MLSPAQYSISIGFVFLLVSLLSLYLTQKAIRILPSFGLIDNPERDNRRIHNRLVATSGGIVMYLAFLAGVFLVYQTIFRNEPFTILIIPITLAVIAGVFDDILELSALFKLFIQTAIALVCFSLGLRVELLLGYNLPVYGSVIVTVVWIVACINAFNLIDGIDGLAAGLGVISSITVGIFIFSMNMFQESTIIFILGASCLGFLKYNFKNAKIFMGDSGSNFIGITFAVISISSSGKLTTFQLLFVPLLAMGLPFFDTILAILRRSLQKIAKTESLGSDKIFSADKVHIHHRLLFIYKDQSKVTLILYTLAAVICAISLFLAFAQDDNKFILILALTIIVFIIVKVLSVIEARIFLNYILSLTRKERFLKGLLASDILSDFFFVGLVVYSANYLFTTSINRPRLETLIGLMYFLIIFIIFPKLIKIYWPKAALSDYFYLIKAIISFFLILLVSNYYFLDRFKYLNSKREIFYFAGENIYIFSTILVILLSKKLFIKWVAEIGIRTISLTEPSNEEIKNTIIYGADLVLSFLKTEYVRKKFRNYDIKGVLSNSSALKSKIVYGYKVLGQFKDLEDIVKSKNINSVLLAFDQIKREDIEHLILFCKEHNIELKKIELKDTSIWN